MSDATICDRRESDCFCGEAAGHDGIHRCECGGSWEYIDGEFTPRSLPGMNRPGPLGDIARDLDYLLGGDR